MKKIMAALLALSLAACKADSPEAVLKQAYEKDKDTQSLTMDGEMGIGVNVEGFELNIPVDIRILSDKHDLDTITDDETYMEFSMSLLGESVAMKLWVVDGVMYMDTNGSKSKSDLEITDPENKPDMEKILTDLLSALDNLKMEKDGGNTIITGRLNKDKLLGLMKDIVAQYGTDEAFGSLEEALKSVEFGDMRIVIGQDGYISRIESGGTMTIENTAGNITVAFDLKDRNSTKIPAVNPAEYETAAQEDIMDDLIDETVLPGGDETDFEFDDYTTQIWFDDGTEYWIRSPEALGVSLYFDDEQQQLYFFDDAVIGAGMFLDTSMMIPAAQEIVGDTEHYRVLRYADDRGMNIIEGICTNESDLMYADTQFLLVLYPEKTYSLIIFSDTDDPDRFSEVMKQVDFELAH